MFRDFQYGASSRNTLPNHVELYSSHSMNSFNNSTTYRSLELVLIPPPPFLSDVNMKEAFFGAGGRGLEISRAKMGRGRA